MLNLQPYVSRVIPLAELPLWSSWPARLLGLSEWEQQTRDVQKIDSEYDKDEYLRCLTYAREHPSATPDEVRSFEFRLPRKPFCVSQKGTLYELPADRVLEVDNAVLVDALSPLMNEVDTVVELGCGYGYNLWELRRRFPDKTFFGGDYSQNAATLAGMLYKECRNLTVETFNFYDASFPMLERCKKGSRVLVFTRHAIEQLPTVQKIVQTLTQYFDRILVGAHLEVAFENYGNSLLDLLRKKYVMLNDYNRDLLGTLRSSPDITLISNDPDVYGVSPLNPSNAIVWRPKKG